MKDIEYYIKHAKKYFQSNKPKKKGICPHNNIISDDDGTYCGDCGLVLGNQNYVSSYEDTKTHDITYIPYKRLSHFKNLLTKYQGKQQFKNSKDNILSLLEEKLNGNITKKNINKVLKENNLNKEIININYFLFRLGGDTVSLSHNQVDILIDMFQKIQIPYHDWNIKHKRKNFLNYNYILFKLFELLNLDNSDFTLLKAENRIKIHDDAWKFICEYNNWKFISSLSDNEP